MREEPADQEINLAAYLDVVWKRRWLIAVPTFVLVLAVWVLSALQPSKWEVDVIVQPSKFLIQTEAGQFVEIDVAAPKQIAGQINQESYNRLIADEINIEIRNFPVLKAENLRDTKLVKISTKIENPEMGKNILNSLYAHLKMELDSKIQIEMAGIETEIIFKKNDIALQDIDIRELENRIALLRLKITDQENAIRMKNNDIRKKNNDIKLNELEAESRAIEKERIRKEIESVENKLKISEDRVTGIHEEMKTVKTRMDAIDEQMRRTLAERKQGTDALSLLLYSNEVQQNLRYYNTLDEMLSLERISQENMNLNIRNLQENIRQLDNQIARIAAHKDSLHADISNILTAINIVRTEIGKIENEITTEKNEIEKIRTAVNRIQREILQLESQKGRIDFTRLVKDPTVSLNPVSHRKTINAAVAGAAGLFLFTILAFFVEHVRNRNKKPENRAL